MGLGVDLRDSQPDDIAPDDFAVLLEGRGLGEIAKRLRNHDGPLFPDRQWIFALHDDRIGARLVILKHRLHPCNLFLPRWVYLGLIAMLEIFSGGQPDCRGDFLAARRRLEIDLLRSLDRVHGIGKLDDIIRHPLLHATVVVRIVTPLGHAAESIGSQFIEFLGLHCLAGRVLQISAQSEFILSAKGRGLGEMELSAAGAGPFKFPLHRWVRDQRGVFFHRPDTGLVHHRGVKSQLQCGFGGENFGFDDQVSSGRLARKEDARKCGEQRRFHGEQCNRHTTGSSRLLCDQNR